jgi:hypothetical protein
VSPASRDGVSRAAGGILAPQGSRLMAAGRTIDFHNINGF